MGYLLKSRRSLTDGDLGRRLSLMAVLVLAVGFLLPGFALAQQGAAAEAASLRIEAVELSEDSSYADLEVMASDPLVWTSYWDAEGRLVVELPNSTPEAAVASFESDSGLVSMVDVSVEEGAWQPITRLTVATRRDVEHSLVAEGNSLRLRLTPVSDGPIAGEDEGSQVASYEPLPASTGSATTEPAGDEMMAEGDEPELREVAMGGDESPQGAEPATGSADDELQVQAVAANGSPATVLQGVEVVTTLGGTTIKVVGDGSFSYESFQLENPSRFVLDLQGVVNTSNRSTLAVDSNTVQRVRVAQFQPFPSPVSRVVFDLSNGGDPVVRAADNGLLVSFGMGAQAEVSMDQPAVEPAADSMRDEPMVAETEPAAEPMTGAADDSSVAVVVTEPADEADSVESDVQVAETEPYEVEPFDEPLAEETGAEAEAVPAEPFTEEGELTEAAEEVAVAEVTPMEDTSDAGTMAEEQPAQQFDDEPFASDTVTAEAPAPPLPELPEVPSENAAGLRVAGVEAQPEDVTSDVGLFEAAEVDFQQPVQEIDPATTDVSPQVVGSGGRVYSGRPITMSLKDADIKDVLRSFSGITDLNVVVHPEVRGSVTVELRDVPWDQALDLILKINGLDYVLEGNIMRIASTSKLQDEADARRRLAAARASEIPLQTVIRAISYADASQIASLLASGGGGGRAGGSRAILSSRGSITVDRRTNKLIIKELPSNMSTVLAIIDNLDTAEPQVLIEARVVETTKSFSRSLGINWGFDAVADDQFGNTTGLNFPHRASAGGGVQLLTGGNNGFLDISLGNVLDTFTLDLSLQAAENEGLVSILSAPKITTLNNQRATIQSGLQIPIQTVANNTVSVQFVNATLQLDVTPQVTAEGTVMMDINLAKREPQLAFAIAGAANAPISTKQARTRVIVRDGGTTVIGGIYEVSNNRGQDRVPGLANVPILGHLFKNRRRNIDNEELLIFITPRVIQL
ncbi:MAG: type IV pilus secretin PilQ [Acidobacteriota bacterium]|nr:type IV pilus secretin PilQ [Acidobacteriota bacterium]